MKTILLVDDNKNIRAFCRAELEQAGYRVLTARDGVEAIQLVRQAEPALVILDVRMPRMNGLETISRIMEVDRSVPVIFFTAYHADCVRDHRGWSATACVEKSEDLTELKQAVAVALQQGPMLGPGGVAPTPASCSK